MNKTLTIDLAKDAISRTNVVTRSVLFEIISKRMNCGYWFVKYLFLNRG